MKRENLCVKGRRRNKHTFYYVEPTQKNQLYFRKVLEKNGFIGHVTYALIDPTEAKIYEFLR